jgi:hypothetical protein
VLLRAGSGFAREALMAWCEANRVDFLFGLARNARLLEEIAPDLTMAEVEAARVGKPARRFRDLRWSPLDSWSRQRRGSRPSCVDAPCGSRYSSTAAVTESTGAVMCPPSDAAVMAAGPDELRGASA